MPTHHFVTPKWNETAGKIWSLMRIKKLRGQMDAVERVPHEGKDCGDILMLLAAVRGGLNGLMAEVLEDHIRLHLLEPSKERIAPERLQRTSLIWCVLT